ncbi:hypothetical protein ACHAWO_009291 [Cyclotella atomus]|uniref:NADH:ubiquinone reductase (non-electrogenic) n=1 Tax=Cyclotella atomus TaxID=382360 RepID=A0ABD3MMF9_9STRA
MQPFQFSTSCPHLSTPLSHTHYKSSQSPKERLLVLGTGWGSAAFLKSISTSKYDVTVVSPRNYFVFTPMLAGASVGTVDFKSIIVPIREINPKARYLEAAATEIDVDNQTVNCVSIVCEGNSCETEEFSLEYDRLIYTVGAQTTTFGTPGVEEYCNYLKQVGDAMQIKNAIVNCFESANLPLEMSEEEKEKELTFVIVGAGPTGIEFAAELLDFIEEDGMRFYKDSLKYVRIKIVEAAPSILRPFEDGMKEEAISRLTRKIEIEGMGTIQPCEILLNKQVSEVTENYVYFKDGDKVPYGMALWAAGIGQLPITASLVEALEGTEQKGTQEFARGRLAVDPWLRVVGGEGKIFALGDCSCLLQNPFLPATAQVAAQQGEFLGKLLSKNYVTNAMGPEGTLQPVMTIDPEQSKTISDSVASFAMGEGEIAPPFQFLDLGILAYTGSGSALAQVQVAPGKGAPNSEDWTPVRLQIKGALGFGLWRSIYLLKQTSVKNIVLVTLDWIKVKLFGRDISIL